MLHQSTTLGEEAAKRALADMYENSGHKYDASLVTAWTAAQHAGINAAFRVAKRAHTLFATKYPSREIADLPSPPSNSDYLQSTLYNIRFVSLKVSES